jgi:predicted amidophosphoribosyltransferase
VPIPLHPHRQRERGFNQSLELARIVGRELRVPCRPQLLRRIRDTAPQSLQPSGQRHANLQGAFAAEPCTGLQIALIDDVFTSGNTIITAAHALLNAGALSVEAWVVARAGGGSA